MITWVSTRARLRELFPDTAREGMYRGASGFVTLALALHIVDANQAAAWTQLAIGTLTCLFALLYSTSSWRVTLYVLVGPIGGALMAYGITTGVDWAIIASAVGQIFGITTAAAKAVQAVPTSPSQIAA